MKTSKVNTEEQPNKISDALIDELLKDYKEPSDLLGEDGILKQLTKRAIERIMDAEMDYHLDDEYNPESGRESGNSRNGKGCKTVKGDFGEIKIETPRDRKSTFQPQIVPKRQHRIGPLDKAVMALYAKGMTTRDILDDQRALQRRRLSDACGRNCRSNGGRRPAVAKQDAGPNVPHSLA
nr:transposase [Cloacibacillus evryensis]